jgi:PD-(D/E)XK nuclease superfamily
MLEKPASPFLSGTNIQFAWDSTSLGYLKTCPRLYYYHMIEGWVPKEDSIHLRFGQEYHQAIYDYEMAKASGEAHEDCVRSTILALLRRIYDWEPDPTLKASNQKSKDQLVHLCVTYFDEYRDDTCKTVILENGKPAVELSFRFELDFGPTTGGSYYILCGHLDRVVEFAGETFVLDHKTTATTPSDYYFNQYSPNNQMTLYTWAGKVVLDTIVSGVIIEAAQVTIEKPMSFHRRPTYRSDEFIDEWLDDLEYHLSSAESFATVGYWPMNDTACGLYGGCRFREVCSRPAAIRQAYLKADFIQLPPEERWNPLRNR